MRRTTNLWTLLLLVTMLCVACELVDDLCHPTASSAASQILSAWCERRAACDPSAPTVQRCVADRLASHHVPEEEDCGNCDEVEDGFACVRSSCDHDDVARCVTEARETGCAEFFDSAGSLVRYPVGCDRCFD